MTWVTEETWATVDWWKTLTVSLVTVPPQLSNAVAPVFTHRIASAMLKFHGVLAAEICTTDVICPMGRPAPKPNGVPATLVMATCVTDVICRTFHSPP